MSGFFRKLNTLVKSQVNDLVDFDKDRVTSRSRSKFLSRHDVSESLQGDVAGLRKRIDEALSYEDTQRARIDKLYQSVTEWDAKADEAVAEGRDQDARFALERMQQAQREIEMHESSLREHNMVTQELISQVNSLEAVVDQARREAASQNVADQQGSSQSQRVPLEIEADDDEDDGQFARALSERMDNTRRQLSELMSGYTGSAMPERAEIIDEVPQPPAPPINRRAVEDDLAARRARLSGPAKPDKKD